MNFKEIFQQITPFLIACPFFVLAMFYYLIVIWKEGGTSVMLLPQVLVILLVSILFLTFDRILLKHGQGILIFVEILLVLFIYLAVEYNGKSLRFQPAKGVSHFWVVSPVDEDKSTKLEGIFSIPFHKRIAITQNNQIVFLSEKTLENYTLKVETQASYTTSGERQEFGNQTLQINLYTLQDRTETDSISRLEKKRVLKEIREVLKN